MLDYYIVIKVEYFVVIIIMF